MSPSGRRSGSCGRRAATCRSTGLSGAACRRSSTSATIPISPQRQPCNRFEGSASTRRSSSATSWSYPTPSGRKSRFEAGHGPRLRPITSRDDFVTLRETIDMGRLAPVLETVRRRQGRASDRYRPDRFLRRALDRGELHGCRVGVRPTRRPRDSAPIATPRCSRRSSIGSSRPRSPISARSSTRAWTSCRSSTVGRGCCRPTIMNAGARRPVRAIVAGGSGRTIPRPASSAFPEATAGNCSARPRGGCPRSASTPPSTSPGCAPPRPRRCRCRATSTPSRCSRAARRWIARWTHILASLEGRPHIFNLGHGILPDTPIAHVERLLRRLRGD